jgi:hypothetical protein
MIKAVVFDCFGVLASDGWLPFREKYFGNDPQLFRKATELNKRTDSGLLSYDEFIEAIARLAKYLSMRHGSKLSLTLQTRSSLNLLRQD